jgi:hypothetical protein
MISGTMKALAPAHLLFASIWLGASFQSAIILTSSFLSSFPSFGNFFGNGYPALGLLEYW